MDCSLFKETFNLVVKVVHSLSCGVMKANYQCCSNSIYNEENKSKQIKCEVTYCLLKFYNASVVYRTLYSYGDNWWVNFESDWKAM